VKNVKKILLTSLIALLVVSFAVSAVAASPDKLAVTGTQIGSTTVISQDLNKGGIYSQFGEGTGQVTLNIEGSTTPLVLKTNSEITLKINTKTDQGVIHFHMKWSKIVNNVEVGAFEGQINGHTLTYAYLPNGYPNYPAQTESYIHTVLQGSGIFSEQKLTLDGIRTIGQPLKWEGFLSTD
jgi:opacity protein-like surface antigen